MKHTWRNFQDAQHPITKFSCGHIFYFITAPYGNKIMYSQILRNSRTRISPSSVVNILEPSSIDDVNLFHVKNKIISGSCDSNIMSVCKNNSGQIYLFISAESKLDIYPINNIQTVVADNLESQFDQHNHVIAAIYNQQGDIELIKPFIRFESSARLYSKFTIDSIAIACNISGSIEFQEFPLQLDPLGPDITPFSFVMFVMPNLSPIWINYIYSTGTAEIISIDADDIGNIYICGNYSGHLYYAQDKILGESIGINIFIIKINRKGLIVWSTQLGNFSSQTSQTNICSDISVKSDRIYIVGTFDANNLEIFNKSDLSSMSAYNSGTVGSLSTDAFLVSYDTNAEPIFARNIRSQIQSNNITVSAGWRDILYLTMHTSDSEHRLLKMESADVEWVLTVSDANNLNVFVDDFGYPVIYGNYPRGVMMIESSNSNILTRQTSSSESNMFVAKYFPNGEMSWIVKQTNTAINSNIIRPIINNSSAYIFGSFVDDLELYNSDGTIGFKRGWVPTLSTFMSRYEESSQIATLGMPFYDSPDIRIISGNSSAYPVIIVPENNCINNVRMIIMYGYDSNIVLSNSKVMWQVVSSLNTDIIHI